MTDDERRMLTAEQEAAMAVTAWRRSAKDRWQSYHDPIGAAHSDTGDMLALIQRYRAEIAEMRAVIAECAPLLTGVAALSLCGRPCWWCGPVGPLSGDIREYQHDPDCPFIRFAPEESDDAGY